MVKYWLIVVAIVILVLLIILVKKYLENLAEEKVTRYQKDLIKKHYDEVQNMYRATRGWRHDYHNHIQTMKVYLQMQEYNQLDKYLQELDKDLTTVDTVIKTGNVMIDAILNSKISLAKSRDINVNAKAIVPPELKISEVDLSLIIGNLMDNAMEAVMKIEDKEQRFIRVYVDILKGQLYIYIMNSTCENLKRVGNIFKTTKKHAGHGLGLSRVDKVVKQYNGYLDRQWEEDVFATEIMLPL